MVTACQGSKTTRAVAVNAALAEAGITIPFPQRDLHLRSVEGGTALALGLPAEEPRPDEGEGRHQSKGPARSVSPEESPSESP